MTVAHDHDHDHAHAHDEDDLPPDVPHSEIHPPDYEVVSMIAARGCRHCGMIVAGTRLFEHRKFHDELERIGLALNGEVITKDPEIAELEVKKTKKPKKVK